MADNDTPRLGLATNEELVRELICRFRLNCFGRITTDHRDIERALTLAEMLGGMDRPSREYRTVDS